jgi:hypothetical protein
MMVLRLIIFLLLFIFPSNSYAKASLYDLLVGGTIKNFARIYVKTSNLPKLKAKYVKKIANMREDKFQRNYMKFFTVYKQLPVDVKQTYIFPEKTTKSKVIDMIGQVNKRDLMAMISKVPSEFIVKQARCYSRPPQQELPENAPVNGIFLWRRIVQKI